MQKERNLQVRASSEGSTRLQALSLGFSDRMIQTRLSSALWEKVIPGVYRLPARRTLGCNNSRPWSCGRAQLVPSATGLRHPSSALTRIHPAFWKQQ
jgi:hypothetical protein